MKDMFQKIHDQIKNNSCLLIKQRLPFLIIYSQNGTTFKAIGKNNSKDYFSTHLFMFADYLENQKCITLFPVNQKTHTISYTTQVVVSLNAICGIQWVKPKLISKAKRRHTTEKPINTDKKTGNYEPQNNKKTASHKQDNAKPVIVENNKTSPSHTTAPSEITIQRKDDFPTRRNEVNSSISLNRIIPDMENKNSPAVDGSEVEQTLRSKIEDAEERVIDSDTEKPSTIKEEMYKDLVEIYPHQHSHHSTVKPAQKSQPDFLLISTNSEKQEHKKVQSSETESNETPEKVVKTLTSFIPLDKIRSITIKHDKKN
ncbi:hypothetical protein ACLIBG_00515 [Virgibacillus sp. W0181]|uniref:hypothetical protein n=1 Tax=Virgibacillus sp. W0181 TaxID=3391581 RepID=UPI003F45A1F2